MPSLLASKYCRDKQFSVKTKSGEFGTCRDCPPCPEGYEVTPPCGTLIPYNATIDCVSCVEGKTFSNTMGVDICHNCGVCSEGQVIKSNCTRQSQIVCSNRCHEKELYFNEYTHDCKLCSHCCGDGHDTVMKECVDKGMTAGMQCSIYDKGRCSQSTEVSAAPTSIFPIQNGSFTQSSVTPSKNRTTEDQEKNSEEPQNVNQPSSLWTIPVIIVCLGVVTGPILLLVWIKLGNNCSPLSSRAEMFRSGNCHRNCSNQSCLICLQHSEGGQPEERIQMTEVETEGDISHGGSSAMETCAADPSDFFEENQSSENNTEIGNPHMVVCLPDLTDKTLACAASNQTKENKLKRIRDSPKGYDAFERVLKHMDHYTDDDGYLYVKLALQFEVEQEDIWEFEKEYKRPGGSPSNELFKYLGAKYPEMTVKDFIKKLMKVEHKGKNDIVKLLEPFMYSD